MWCNYSIYGFIKENLMWLHWLNYSSCDVNFVVDSFTLLVTIFTSKIFTLDLYWSFSSFTGCSYLQEVYNFLWSGCTICKVRLWTWRNTYGPQYWKMSSLHCILQMKSAFIQTKNDTKNTYLHVKCIVSSTIILFAWMYVAIPKNTKFCNRWHIR